MEIFLTILVIILLGLTPLGRVLILAIGWLVSVIASLLFFAAVAFVGYVLLVAAFG